MALRAGEGNLTTKSAKNTKNWTIKSIFWGALFPAGCLKSWVLAALEFFMALVTFLFWKPVQAGLALPLFSMDLTLTWRLVDKMSALRPWVSGGWKVSDSGCYPRTRKGHGYGFLGRRMG